MQNSKRERPSREIDRPTRERIAEHLRWWMALHGKKPADVERLTGVHNSTISRLLHLTQRSLGLDVFLKLSRNLKIDAELMANESPDWERVRRAHGGVIPPISTTRILSIGTGPKSE